MTVFFQELPILSNSAIAPGIHRIRFSSSSIASQARPGQFVMIRPMPFQEPLLPRPFSIHRVREDRVDILFKVRGRGTRLLAGLQKGEMLEVRGPLGKGFRFQPEQDLVLVAGGIGVAPLLFAAETWKKAGGAERGGSLKVLVGARTHSELLCRRDFQKTGARLFTATEDGSAGARGLITRLLKEVVDRAVPSMCLLACGPPPMLRAVQRWALNKGISCQLSLETRMACGLGVCLGCVTALKGVTGLSYVNVCREGPVFDAREVVWDEPIKRS